MDKRFPYVLFSKKKRKKKKDFHVAKMKHIAFEQDN